MDPYKKHFKKMKKKKGISKEESLHHLLRPKKARQRAPFPMSVVAYSLLICFLMTLGLSHLDYLEKLSSKVSISFLASSKAQDTTESEKKNLTKEESGEEKSTELRSEMAAQNKKIVPKDMNYFKMLEAKEEVLAKKEIRLKKLEENLQVQQEELAAKMRALEQMRTDISFALKGKVETDEKTVDRLVQVYANMKPKQAATVLETMKEELAVKILSKMKKKSAAAILNVLKTKRAQDLTEKIAGYEN